MDWPRNYSPISLDLDFTSDQSILSNLDLSLPLDENQSFARDVNGQARRLPALYRGARPASGVELAKVCTGQGPNNNSAGVFSLDSSISGSISGSSSLGSGWNLTELPSVPTQSSATEHALSPHPDPPIEVNADAVDGTLTRTQLLLEQSENYGSFQPSHPRSVAVESADNGLGKDAAHSPTHKVPTSSPLPDNASWVRKLSNINVQLFQHAAMIPPVHDSQPKVSTPSEAGWNAKELAVDKTFHLSQLLIEILNHLHPRFLSTPSSVSCPPTPPGSRHCSLNPSSATMSPLSSAASLDQGSILLVLSSYLRLIDAYDRIFRHVHASVAETRVTAKDRQVRLPQLTIGTFSPPPSSVMQISQVVHLAETLLTHIRKLVGSMERPPDWDGAEEVEDAEKGAKALEDVTDVTLCAIRAKEAETMKRLNGIKRLLQQSSVW